MQPPERLRDLMNLGPASEQMLVAAGITTPRELDEAGALEAFRRAVEAGAPAHTMLLWALDGAILDVDWRDLPADRREHLRKEGRRLTQGYSGH